MATQEVTTGPAPHPLLVQLTSPEFAAQIAKALPQFLRPEYFLRLALTCANDRQILESDPTSVLEAFLEAAQCGLVLDGVLGHAYIVTFFSKRDNVRYAQLIPGYRGLMAMARRSGEIGKIEPRAVYQGDQFEFAFGLQPKLVHVPCPADKRGPLTHVYAIASYKDGTPPQYDVMTRSEVDAIRKRSPSARSERQSPWDTDYDPMALKTVIRRLCKYLPVSVELQRVISKDEAFETARWAESETPEPATDQPKQGDVRELNGRKQVYFLATGWVDSAQPESKPTIDIAAKVETSEPTQKPVEPIKVEGLATKSQCIAIKALVENGIGSRGKMDVDTLMAHIKLLGKKKVTDLTVAEAEYVIDSGLVAEHAASGAR